MYGTAMGGIFGGSGVGAVRSLDFDGSSDYLSMSAANFGAWQGSKLAIAGSLYMNDPTDRGIISYIRDDNSVTMMRIITTSASMQIQFYDNSGTIIGEMVGGTISTDTWTSFLIHYDGLNGTSTDRLKLWLNGSAVTPGSYNFPTAQTSAGASSIMRVGLGTNASDNFYDGLQFSIAFFNGTLPTPTQIFNGTAGKVKSFVGLAGLQSWLDGDTATADRVRAADWTNNGTVTVNASVP